MNEDKEQYLRDRGWFTWYHPNYWVHEKVVADPQAQDPTNYGMSLEVAYRYETEGGKPFSLNPLDILPYWNQERRG